MVRDQRSEIRNSRSARAPSTTRELRAGVEFAYAPQSYPKTSSTSIHCGVNQTAISLASVVGQRPEISDQRSEVRGTPVRTPFATARPFDRPALQTGGTSGVSERRSTAALLNFRQFDSSGPGHGIHAPPPRNPAYNSRRQYRMFKAFDLCPYRSWSLAETARLSRRVA